MDTSGIDRDGAEWVGMNAELYRSARAAEKEKEEQAVKEEKAARAAAKRAIVTTLDTTIFQSRLKSNASNQKHRLDTVNRRPHPSRPTNLRRRYLLLTRLNQGRRRVSGPAAVGIGGGGGEGQGRSRAQSQGATEALLCLPARLDGTKAPTNGNNGQGKGLRRASGSSKLQYEWSKHREWVSTNPQHTETTLYWRKYSEEC
jgi:hypothetical protein